MWYLGLFWLPLTNFGFSVANLCNFWNISWRPNSLVVYQNWQISSMPGPTLTIWQTILMFTNSVANMSFWSENYSFIKDVYDTRVSKMIEWMDHVEMAIQKVRIRKWQRISRSHKCMFTTIWIQVMATKVYTSAEFKRERDNFLSLIKNMEKADTKKWLDEVKETLFRSKEWTRDYDLLV